MSGNRSGASCWNRPWKMCASTFVRAVAEKHLVGLHAVIASDGLLEQVAVRVRVQAQVLAQFAAHGFQRFRRRAIRVFVGVELDQF
ncbi:sialidase-3, partial [Corchorus olitorius]